ncbi:prolactin-releasing peptide receptor-like [Tigriopus californicus]|nr:prolactin-releasing peptide receptor-like [Tigriopus californicus]
MESELELDDYYDVANHDMVHDNQSVPCPEQKLINETWIRVVIILFYLIIFVIGFFGNMLVILVVAKNKVMHSPTNIFIVNMALSDVLMCVFAVPFTPIHSFMPEWMFGEVLCKLFPTSQGVSVYMSTLTLTCIAVDRYIAIVHPYRPRMENKTSYTLACSVNALAVLFTAPYAWYMTVKEDPETGLLLCSESWYGMPRTIYGAFTNIMQFVLPFTTIFVCYSVIMARLAQRYTTRPGASRQSAAKEEAEKERKKKNNRLCVSMVVIFGTCWFPLNVINFLADIELFPIFCWDYYHFTFFMCHILAMSSNCYNPFLYGWLNESFRTEFLKMIPALKTICGGDPRRPAAVNNCTRDHRNDQNGMHRIGQVNPLEEPDAPNDLVENADEIPILIQNGHEMKEINIDRV